VSFFGYTRFQHFTKANMAYNITRQNGATAIEVKTTNTTYEQANK